jgi:hypothetical protein
MAMKKLALAALGALMMAGTTAATTAPAQARVSIGIGIGVPGGYYPPSYCDPYSYRYDPYLCNRERYYDYYYEPIYFGGSWYRGPFRHRYWHGYHQYWVGGGWHRNEWHGGHPGHHDWHGGWHGGGDHHGGGHHHH